MTTEDRSTLLLTDVGEVQNLASDVPALRRDYRRIRVDLADLPDPARHAWELRLNRHLRGRGTELAAIGYVVALVLYGAYLWVARGALPDSLDALSVGVALMVGGAAVGKVIGLTLANRALRRSAILLEALLRASSSSERASRDGTPGPRPGDRLARVA
ncbi:MAG: hypothetical protein R3E10_14890 [Gemmatimonadota bacterium]